MLNYFICNKTLAAKSCLFIKLAYFCLILAVFIIVSLELACPDQKLKEYAKCNQHLVAIYNKGELEGYTKGFFKRPV